MAFAYFDRVKETSATTGTGAIALAGAVSGYRRFSAVFSTSDTMYYCIQDQNGPNWEIGLGTYSSANTLTRTSVLASSNSNLVVNFTSAALLVFVDITAIVLPSVSGGLAPLNSPALVTPALGTPSSGNLANCTFPTLNQNTTGTAGGLLTSAITGLAADATPDPAADYVMSYDASATAMKKVLIGNLGGVTPIWASGTYATSTTLTATIPLDNSIPQIGEGTEIIAVTMSPAKSTSSILLLADFYGGDAADGDHIIAALFQDATANALATAARYNNNSMGTRLNHVHAMHLVAAGSTSSRTYRLRVGGSGNNLYPNSVGSPTPYFGGSMACRLIAIELPA